MNPTDIAMQRLYKVAALIFLLCSGLLTSPWWLGRVTIPWDAKAHFYPQLVFLANALHGTDLPFWNPHIFAGSAQIADPQSLIFTLPYLLLAMFDATPGFVAADAVVFITLILGGLALIAFFRDRNWHPAGALVAALAFTFGGSAAWRIQHIGEVLSIAFFAITFWLLARVLERGSWKAGLGAGFFGGLMVIGRDQIAWLCTIILIGAVIWHILAGRGWVGRLKLALPALIVGLVTGSAVIALPIALTVALAQQSNRVLIDFAGAARGSLHPASLLTAVVANLYGTDGPMPDFWGPAMTPVWAANNYVLARNMSDVYFGALPLIAFLAIGLAGSAFIRSEARFLLAAFIAMLLYSVGDFTPFFKLAFAIPGSDLFRRPSDATFPLCALAAILAGYAVHRWMARETKQGSPVSQVLIVLVPFALAVGVAVWKGRFAQASLPLVTAAICLAVSGLLLVGLRRFGPRHAMLALVAIGAVMTADLAVNNGPNESTALPPAHYDVLRTDTQNVTIALLRKKLDETAGPDRRDRVEMAAIGFDWPNLGMIHGFDHDLGYNPVRFELYVEATGAQDHVAVADQRHFSPLFPSYRSRMADMLGLRFIATGIPVEEVDKNLKPGDLQQIARTPDAYVYENQRALPRVLFATRAQDADFEQLIKTGEWPDVDPRETVLIEGAKPDDVVRRPGTARLSFYENTRVRVSVDAPDGGWLVLNDVWQPWWRVEIDNVSVPLLRANVIFRAVQVPPGRHDVRFVFEPLAGLWAQIRSTRAELPK
ncbi:MAG: hypothetical protein JWL62_1025 [Hyphomicrobiales bacterium]|nr:hypothetical protein [Hyphomicrobiales bacterium]